MPRPVITSHNSSGGGLRLLRMLFFIILSIISFAGSAGAVGKADIKILYFFKDSCTHCQAVAAYVKELSKEYTIEGWVSTETKREGYPFPVKVGSRKIAPMYGVQGVPTMVVLVNGTFKTKIAGERDIKNSRQILKAVEQDAITVSEAYEKKPAGAVLLTGWVENLGEYFKQPKFFLTDRQKRILIKPWLPLEAAKSPFSKKSGPRLMSDVINRPVLVKGNLNKKDDVYQFNVSEEINLEEK